eukprot:2871391-Prymnesium_polylepis.1
MAVARVVGLGHVEITSSRRGSDHHAPNGSESLALGGAEGSDRGVCAAAACAARAARSGAAAVGLLQSCGAG